MDLTEIKPGKVYNVKEAADVMRLTPDYVRKLARSGKLNKLTSKWSHLRFAGYQILEYCGVPAPKKR